VAKRVNTFSVIVLLVDLFSMVVPFLQESLVCREVLRCVIPVVCVTNKREESVVNQHN